MSSDRHYRDLAPGQRHLVDLMRQIGFGRIENLLVQRGQPVFAPSPRVFREIKLEHGAADTHPAASGDYLLKDRILSLLGRLEALGNGRIESIIITHGLPLRMTVETTPTPGPGPGPGTSACGSPAPARGRSHSPTGRRAKSLTG